MRESRVTCTIKPCRGCTDHLNELEARYHKAQAEAWQRRARQLKGDNLMLHDKVEMLQRHLAWYRAKVGGLKAENAKLREQMERLVTLLRVDWDIDVSWDGLRRFWYVGLTDEGVRKRDEREATLGRGTCHNAAPSYLDFLCSECGFVHYHSDENDSGDGNEWRYCPNCGRRIVEVD